VTDRLWCAPDIASRLISHKSGRYAYGAAHITLSTVSHVTGTPKKSMTRSDSVAICENCAAETGSKFCPDCGTAMAVADSASNGTTGPTDVASDIPKPNTGPATDSAMHSPPPPPPAHAPPDMASATTPPPARRGIPTVPVAIGASVLVVGLIAGAWAVFGSSTDTLTGVFSLRSSNSATGDWDTCEGDGGYSDLDAGVPVRIENQDGKRIGAATLQNLSSEHVATLAQLELDGFETGTMLVPIDEMDDMSVEAVASSMERTMEVTALLGWCNWYWQAEVETADIYNFEIGKRGDIDLDRAELEADGFLVTVGID
jgi:hypothetical protein